MKVRILTSCTGEKLFSPDNQLNQDDFRLLHDRKAFKAREDSLAEFRTAAEDLYTGQQHLRLMQGIKQLQEKAGPINVELWILSAGYGLIPGDRQIVPYECTFQGMKTGELRQWAEHLRVAESAQQFFAEPADLNLILLGDSYLKALCLTDSFPISAPTLFLTSDGALKQIKGKGQIVTVPLSNREAKRFSCGLVALKGELAKRILVRLANEEEALKSKLLDPACDFLDLLDGSAPASSAKRSPAKANPNVDRVIEIPSSWWQKPHREKLRYFIPEWDDLVDPDYDFETDIHSGGQGDWSNETCAHQMYPEPNDDDILITKVVAEKSKKMLHKPLILNLSSL